MDSLSAIILWHLHTFMTRHRSGVIVFPTGRCAGGKSSEKTVKRNNTLIRRVVKLRRIESVIDSTYRQHIDVYSVEKYKI